MDTRARRILTATLLVVALGALALTAGIALGRRTATAPTRALTQEDTTTSEPPRGTASPEMVEFRGPGFAISHPADWRRLDSGDPEVPLVATTNGRDSFLVRLIDLDDEVTEADLPDLKRLTDDLVTSSRGVELLAQPQRIELAGLPGYYYFYAFDDGESGQRGAHAHYFLLDGSRFVTLVFQALPLSRFDDLASTFDAIASSLEVLPADG